MANSGSAVAGSFRDPSGRVYDEGGRIYRSVTAGAAADFEFVRSSGFYDALVAQQRAIGAQVVEDDGSLALDTAFDPSERHMAALHCILEHPRLPIISYPYEWCFPALKAAALHHLRIHREALERGVTLSDASAYNIQFRGAKPVFIDTLSFRAYREGEFWLGHRQFCEQFLNPLLLRAYLGITHNAWYRGTLDGIASQDLLKLLPWTKKLGWNLLTQLVLPSHFDESARKGNVTVDAKALESSGFPRAAYLNILKRLENWISGLTPRGRTPTIWQNYNLANSYAEPDVQAKRAFIETFIEAEKPRMVWDFGCNTGDYSELALSSGAGYVVGWDFDQGALEAAFDRAHSKDLAFTPLFLDAANPSPDQGWAQAERGGIAKRDRPDACLALAFIHHLAIARNIPLPEIIDWLLDLAPCGVVEFVPKEDETVRIMLRIREDIFTGYDFKTFFTCLENRAAIVYTVKIGDRHLVWFKK